MAPGTRWTARLEQVAESPEALPALASEHERQVEALRGDVAKWGTYTDRTRLARELARLAVVRRLMGDHAACPPLFEEAYGLFATDARDVAGHLVPIRYAHAEVAAGRAAEGLARIEALEELITEPHRDSFLLVRGLARAHLGDAAGARVDWEAARALRAGRGRGAGTEELDTLLAHLAARG
jgi:hypothetical protein